MWDVRYVMALEESMLNILNRRRSGCRVKQTDKTYFSPVADAMMREETMLAPSNISVAHFTVKENEG